MKILLLAHGDISGYYAASLLERGHHPIITHGGGTPLFEKPEEFVNARKTFMGCDACLLIGDNPEILEIADHFAVTGKPIWYHLAQVPRIKL